MAVSMLSPFRSVEPGREPNGLASAPASGAAAEVVHARNAPIAILGVPFDNVTTAETVAMVERMVRSGLPHYLATANVDFLVQALHDVELRRILFDAHLVLCDGTPLVWASRWLGNPLPERVAGSDLVPLLVKIAAERGYRVYFLGGASEATAKAIERLRKQYPALVIAGAYSPPFSALLDMDHEEIRRRVAAARPDMLFVSFGCPKQEKWIAMHYRALGVPVCIGVGGTIDFLAGRLARAPRWMQQTGTEWVFRLVQEPRRLLKRYAKDLWYFGGALLLQWFRMQLRFKRRPAMPSPRALAPAATRQVITPPEWLDADAVQRETPAWDQAWAAGGDILVDLGGVRFIDSTGVGLLIRWRKRLALHGRDLVLVSPGPVVRRALESMRLWSFFLTADDVPAAEALLDDLRHSEMVSSPDIPTGAKILWQGEVTAANSDQVWEATRAWLRAATTVPRPLGVDLGRVSFIDSTGLGLMVRARKEATTAGCTLRFENLQPAVQNVIHLARLESFLLGE